MPRTLKLLLLVSVLAAPLCATAPAQAAQQTPAAAAAQTPAAEDNFARGRRLLKEGNASAAAPLLKRAAEARKTDAEAWQQLGVALLRLGKRGDARKAFEKALKARPDWPLARASLAYALLAQGKARDAEREATRALALDPNLADAHFVLGSIRFHEENFAQAVADAEAALRLNPDFPAAAFLYGDALLNLYIDESTRQGERYPLTPAADEQTRKAAFEKRDAALGPFKARMRENADRLEGFAKGWGNSAEAERLRELASSLRLYGRLDGESMGIFRQGEVTTKAIITFKPEPGFTEEARQQNVTGRVRLRAVLAADGQVRNIVPIKRLPAGLTEKCVAVARKIKFTPATVNGSPVSQFVLLEYNFNIY
jgi:Flp pilus assembly protein TadD